MKIPKLPKLKFPRPSFIHLLFIAALLIPLLVWKVLPDSLSGGGFNSGKAAIDVPLTDEEEDLLEQIKYEEYGWTSSDTDWAWEKGCTSGTPFCRVVIYDHAEPYEFQNNGQTVCLIAAAPRHLLVSVRLDGRAFLPLSDVALTSLRANKLAQPNNDSRAKPKIVRVGSDRLVTHGGREGIWVEADEWTPYLRYGEAPSSRRSSTIVGAGPEFARHGGPNELVYFVRLPEAILPHCNERNLYEHPVIRAIRKTL